MAALLWGQVYFHDAYAGVLRQEPGERCSFTYDKAYLAAGYAAIAWTLPLQEQPHISPQGLHSFFENLVAEGWLEEAQTRLLGKRQASRFELLLAFGQDCAGAVSMVDPTPAALKPAHLGRDDPRQLALLKNRASLSGVQPKFTLVKRQGKFHPAEGGQLSTHFAKFASPGHADLVFNEYLTTLVFKALLPGDPVVDLAVGDVEGFAEPALIIPRFDRTADGGRLHFEEFNQLLGRPSAAKYDGAYREMADFLSSAPGGMPAQVFTLYLRILAGMLLGNTDMHLKNFAMFHGLEGLRLTPSYDQVAAALYGYKTVALAIGTAANLSWSTLKAGSLIRLGADFSLSPGAMAMAYEKLAARKEAAVEAIHGADVGAKKLQDDLIKMVQKRWNGTFSLIGRGLSKKP